MSRNTAPPAERVDKQLLRTAFILVLGTFMATLDATIVSVGIDGLAHEFGASVAEIQWVTTAYLLAVVAAVPASGWLADRFGGRRTWLVAVGVFLLGSALCASARSVTSLIVFRVIQGLGGGLLPATGQALLARIAGPGRTGRVISVVAVVPLLSPVLGLLAGGSILAVAPWPWLFLVNLPVGAVAVLLARRHVPAVPPSTRRTAFDLRGALLLSPGLAVLVFGLTEVAHGRTLPATAGVTAGLAMLAGFTVHGLRTRRTPLVDPRLFARPPFGAAAVALLVLGASVFGTMFLLPLYFQTGRGMSAWGPDSSWPPRARRGGRVGAGQPHHRQGRAANPRGHRHRADSRRYGSVHPARPRGPGRCDRPGPRGPWRRDGHGRRARDEHRLQPHRTRIPPARVRSAQPAQHRGRFGRHRCPRRGPAEPAVRPRPGHLRGVRRHLLVGARLLSAGRRRSHEAAPDPGREVMT